MGKLFETDSPVVPKAAERTLGATLEQHELEEAEADSAGQVVDVELLVEDVSIDGMCGVY